MSSAWGWAPKTDLLRVDVLNTIGLSMMLMGVLCWLVLAVFLVIRQEEKEKQSADGKGNEGAPSLPRPLRQEPALSEQSEPQGWETERSVSVGSPRLILA